MIRKIIGWLCRPITIEDWAVRMAPIAGSPDEMIAGHIIQLLVSEYEEWSLITPPVFPGSDSDQKWEEYYAWKDWWDGHVSKLPNSDVTHLLLHERRKIYIFYKLTDTMSYRDVSPINISVNFVNIDQEQGQKIYEARERIKNERQRLERIAAEALAEQQQAESKWNVYEAIAGFTRTKEGALCVTTKY